MARASFSTSGTSSCFASSAVKAGDPLELLQVTAACLFKFLLLASLVCSIFVSLLGLVISLFDCLLALLVSGSLSVDVLFFLFDPLFDPLDFFAPLGQFAIEIGPESDRVVLGGDRRVSPFGFRFFQDLVGLILRQSDAGVGALVEVEVGREEG